MIQGFSSESGQKEEGKDNDQEKFTKRAKTIIDNLEPKNKK